MAGLGKYKYVTPAFEDGKEYPGWVYIDGDMVRLESPHGFQVLLNKILMGLEQHDAGMVRIGTEILYELVKASTPEPPEGFIESLIVGLRDKLAESIKENDPEVLKIIEKEEIDPETGETKGDRQQAMGSSLDNPLDALLEELRRAGLDDLGHEAGGLEGNA